MVVLALIIGGTLTLPILASGSVVLRLFLAGVTLVSGVGKLADTVAGAQAMTDFGAPPRLAGSAARLLPIVEIVLGFLLLNDDAARQSALALSGLFALFSLAVLNLLRQKKAPPCNCFGALEVNPVSNWTLARVLTLSILALACCCLPVFPLINTWSERAALAFLYLIIGFRIRKVAQKKGTKPKRLRVGQRLPAITLWNGEWLADILPQSERTLLFLTSSDCHACGAIKQNLTRWAPTIANDLPILELVATDAPQAFEPVSGLTSYPLRKEAAYRLFSPTPGAFLVDRTGTILVPPVFGAAQIRALIRLTLKRPAESLDRN